MPPYATAYAMVITLAFVAASFYAIGRFHDARNRVEAFRLGWRRGVEWSEERDLRRLVAGTRHHSAGEGARPGSRIYPGTAMPINQRRPTPRPSRRMRIEEAPTVDMAGHLDMAGSE